MPDANLHFPKADTSTYIQSWQGRRCAVMQGGQGDIKHWAFNDPLPRLDPYIDVPPTPEAFRWTQDGNTKIAARIETLGMTWEVVSK